MALRPWVKNVLVFGAGYLFGSYTTEKQYQEYLSSQTHSELRSAILGTVPESSRHVTNRVASQGEVHEEIPDQALKALFSEAGDVIGALFYVIAEVMKEVAPDTFAQMKSEFTSKFTPEWLSPASESSIQAAEQILVEKAAAIETKLGHPMSEEERSELLVWFVRSRPQMRAAALQGILQGLFLANPPTPERADPIVLENVFDGIDVLAREAKADDPGFFREHILPAVSTMEIILSRWVRESKPELCTALLLRIIMVLKQLS